MRLEDIREMHLQVGQCVEIRFVNDQGLLETRWGKFQQLFEMPQGMTKIPDKYKHAYPVEPPYVEIAHTLDKNHCPCNSGLYKPERIHYLTRLFPEEHPASLGVETALALANLPSPPRR